MRKFCKYCAELLSRPKRKECGFCCGYCQDQYLREYGCNLCGERKMSPLDIFVNELCINCSNAEIQEPSANFLSNICFPKGTSTLTPGMVFILKKRPASRQSLSELDHDPSIFGD